MVLSRRPPVGYHAGSAEATGHTDWETAMRFYVGLACVLVASAGGHAQPMTDYGPAVARLEKLIEREVADKKLPALSVALVDDQRVVWAKGFGHRDRAKTDPATPGTVYRVGSVSKLFTDVAVMRLVERGVLDLDAPVAKYLPDFKPANPFNATPVTLRMLMAHRSGLVREPPVGNYFDPTEPPLEKTVASLNGVDLVYPPGERIKYSNAAVAVVGAVLQKTQGERYENYVKKQVLDPLGMGGSDFSPTPAVRKNLADAVMWTYHGREFPAPTFELGESPAGCLYAPVTDLAKFASCLFAGGKAGGGQLLKPETVDAMLSLQFAKPDDKAGFGIGFIVGDLDGRKRVGHGGAVYGFATELAALPGDKLGVVVVCSRDVANAVTSRLADDALRLMLAAKAGKDLPTPTESEPLPAAEAKALAGRYRAGERWIDFTGSDGRLFGLTDRGNFRLQFRKHGPDLIADDVLGWGNLLTRKGDRLVIAGTEYEREERTTTPPAAPPDAWRGLIGEYGWDHNTLFILEREGKLHALIEWVFLYPLAEVKENVFAFPDYGLYHGEKLIFSRDPSGRATKVEAAKVVFGRRKIDGEGGETFRVRPVRPLADLRKAALAAAPPVQHADLRKPDLVDLGTMGDGFKFDVRYATANNFLGTPFYTSAKAYVQRPAADALGRVRAALKPLGYGLLVYDAYRPWHVTRMFWDATPEKFHNFVADPAKGSRHNRGCAIDLGLYDLATGKPVEVVSGFDEFSDRAFPDYLGGTSRQRWHRDLLRRAMEAEGFRVYEEEWWHFDYKDWASYPVMNATFEELGKK